MENNQSPLRYSHKRLNDRAIDELIGLSRGMAADGIVNQAEAEYLKQWMEANVSYCEDRLVNQLYCRVQEMLVDKILDRQEQQELFQLMKMFTGDVNPGEVARNLSTSLPIDDPPPPVEFPTMSFCLTGTFAYGPRRICEEVIIERGGQVQKKVSAQLDYLVVGLIGSRDWIHTSYGRKIEQAAKYREKYGSIVIITEDHWADHAFRMC